MIAVVCSTWSVVNLATSQRDVLCPLGQSMLASVRSANRMVSRKGLGGWSLNLLDKDHFLMGAFPPLIGC